MALLAAVWMSLWWGPVICGFSVSTELVKIFPTGAFVEERVLEVLRSPAVEYSAGSLGRLPVCLKT